MHPLTRDLTRDSQTRTFRETFKRALSASRVQPNPGFTRKLLPNYGNQETFRYTRSALVYMANYQAWSVGSAARGTCIRFQGRICPVARGLIERGLAGRRRRYQRVLQIMRARMQPRIDRREGERERERERSWPRVRAESRGTAERVCSS